MAEPVTPQPSEGETTPSSSGQPNYIARSMLRIMRRAEQSLSPWSRRMLNTPSLVQRQTGEAPSAASGPVARSPFTALNTSSAISRRAAQPLVQRVQNIVAKSSQIQRSAEPGLALSLNRFSSAVINRFPERASRYEAQAADSSEVVQRAALPFVGGDSSPSESPASVNVPTAADVEMAALRNSGDEAFYPQVTPQDSVASQLSERLQAFREPGSAALPAPSPRQISRMTADRVSRRTDSSAPVRRSSIEEVDPKSSSLPSLTPPSSPTVQRQPAAPSAQPPTAPAVQRSPEAPSAPSQPTIQRKPASFASDEPALQSSPAMPSLTQQLLKRFQAGRDEWENPTPAAEAPAAPRSTPSATPPAVQRTPDAAPPSTPSTPPVITEHHSRPVRRAAQLPAVQRQAEPTPAAETPGPSVTPTVESPSAPTVQRQAEAPSQTSAPAAPVDSAPVATPASPTAQRTPAETAAAPSQAPVQRSITSAPQGQASEAGAASTVATPAIQRTPDQPPTIQRSPAEAVTVPSPVSTPSAAPIQRSPTEPVDVPSPASSPSAAPIQRSVTTDPYGPTPVTAAPPAIQRASDDLPLHPPSTPTASVPAAPVSTPPVSTQPAAPTPTSAPASATASIQRSPDPAHSVSQPGPNPSSSAASTQTVQRQPAVAQPSAPTSQPIAAAPVAPAAPQSIQRTATEAIQTSMPLARPPSQPLQPAMALTVQRAPAALAEESPMAVAVREPAVTAQVARKPMAVVQRQSAGTASQTADISRANLPLAKAAPAPTITTKVQRALTESSSDFESAPDDARDKAEVKAPSREALANLAKQIYPILKRMLAVERERR